MRKNIHDIGGRKGSDASPLVCLTAYTAQMASLLDPHCDLLLVGDSVAMVVYGHPSTLQADMDMMIRHGQAVMRGSQNALVVVDMPFGSYQESPAQAFRNAALILKETQAQAVKIEGGAEMAETIAYLTTRGIPVVGHVGLMPQSFNTLGGYKAQGRDDKTAEKIMADAKSVANSGAFAIVIEGVAEGLAASITRAVSCPTIGIGASADCDGQILVCDDMLGITQGKKPKFVKEYANLGASIDAAVTQYAKEVASRQFPDAKYLYGAAKPATVAPAAPAPVPAAQVSAPDQQDNNRPSASNLILRAIRPKS